MKKIFLCALIMLCAFAFLGCNDVSEADNLRKENEDLKTKVDEKQNELDNLKTKVDEKQNELDDLKTKVDEKQNELDDLKTEVDEKLSEKENLITSLQDKIKDLEEEIELKTSLFEKIKLDNECIDMLNEIIENGVSLDDYLKFKESNDKIKNDDEIKELFDKIYYYYNKTMSLSYFEKVMNLDGISMYEVNSGYEVLVDFGYCIDSDTYTQHYSRLIFSFYDSNREMQYFLNDRIDWDNREHLLVGNNFFVDIGGLYYKDYVIELCVNFFGYINDLIENNTFITYEEFSEEISKIEDLGVSKYQVQLAGKRNYKKYLASKDDKFLFGILYLEEESNENYSPAVWEFRNRYGWMSDDRCQIYYENVYLFGRLTFYFEMVDGYEENADIIKNTEIYSEIIESGLNGWDVYLGMNS